MAKQGLNRRPDAVDRRPARILNELDISMIMQLIGGLPDHEVNRKSIKKK